MINVGCAFVALQLQNKVLFTKPHKPRRLTPAYTHVRLSNERCARLECELRARECALNFFAEEPRHSSVFVDADASPPLAAPAGKQ